MTHAAKIALAFLADIRYEQESAPHLGWPGQGPDTFRECEEGSQACAVIRDAGTAEVALPVHRNVVFRPRRENGVEVGRYCDEAPCRVGFDSGQNIPCAIYGGMPAERPQRGTDPFGPFLFHESRCRNAA